MTSPIETELTGVDSFAGVGGFSLAMQSAGIRVVMQIEKDRDCLSVLERRFPNIARIDDVKKAGQTNLPDGCFLFAGGSPCQDLSTAGKRAGLGGSQSGLWYEFHRLLGILKPRWFVWENVPGVLSSGSPDPFTGRERPGLDFSIVLAGFTGTVFSVPEKGWRNSGVANGWFYNVAWRVLDAQFFGVAQRRRRVFVVGCAASSGFSPAEVLFEREGMSWNPPPRRPTRTRPARQTATGAAERDPNRAAQNDADFAASLDAWGARHMGQAGQRPTGVESEADFLIPVDHGQAQDYFAVQRSDQYAAASVDATLAARDYKSAADIISVEALDVRNLNSEGDLSGTLQTKANGGHSLNYQNPVIIESEAQAQSTDWDIMRARIVDENDIAPTIGANEGRGGFAPTIFTEQDDDEVLEMGLQQSTSWANKSIPRPISPTLSPGESVIAFMAGQGAKARSIDAHDDLSPTLRSSDSGTNQTPGVIAPEEITAFDWQAGDGGDDKSFRGKSRAYIVRRGDYAQLRASAIDAVHGRFGVRRLMPIETERLQGFPVQQETVIINLWRQSETSVRAEISKPQKVKPVGNVENGRLLKTVKSAEGNSLPKNPSSNEPAPLNVHIFCEEESIKIYSQGKFCLSVNFAESRKWFPRLTRDEDFALLVAGLNIIAAQTTSDGREALQANAVNLTLRLDGDNFAPSFGDETTQPASAAVNDITTRNRLLKSITSSPSRLSQKDSTPAILLCSVLNAIAGYIPNGILASSSCQIEINSNFGWTFLQSDTARYRQMGNGVCVNVIKWIVHRLVAVDRQSREEQKE